MSAVTEKQVPTMTREDAARHLAELQRRINPTIRVFRVLPKDAALELSECEPIKLLWVNEYTFPSDEISPLGFNPTTSSGHFPTIIMDVTPEQFEQIQSGGLPLPHNWKMGEELTSGGTSP